MFTVLYQNSKHYVSHDYITKKAGEKLIDVYITEANLLSQCLSYDALVI